MKKKGLIVATIVMVLVLAVSLTTATYAWFTAIDETTITDIGFSVGAGSDVIIGVKENGEYDGSATEAHFWSDNTLYTGTVWTGETQGFGQSIDTGLDLTTITQAIGTGKATTYGELDGEGNPTVATPGVVASAWDLSTEGYTVIKANGSGTTADTGTVNAAVANGYDSTKGDYLDIVLGVKPAKANLTSITLNITINPDQNTKTVIGMNSAIHVIFGIEQAAPTKPTATNAYTTGMKSGEIDVYGNHHYGTNVSTISAASTFAAQGFSTSTEALNAGWTNLAIVVATAEDGQFLPVNEFYQIHIIIFIAGYDTDCVQSAMGVGADICLNFTAEEGTVA